MTPLLIVVAWMLILLLVVGLCVAARLGDLALAGRSSVVGGHVSAESSEWEPVTDQPIVARSTIGRPRAGGSRESSAGAEIAA